MRADQRARRDDFLNRIGTHPAVMGILNVTPDSFSDGGRFLATEAAVSRARSMAAQGCAIIDVGGESTRPGGTPVPESEEWARIEPVIDRLARDLVAPLSVDTTKANVARRAVDVGAVMVNDVWGLQKDPAMADTVAAAEAAVVIMHNRREKDATIDIVADMRRFFDHSLALAARAGIPARYVILDPGIGFAKTARQNVAAIARLGELKDFGRPIMVGVSRKAFFGSLAQGGVESELVGTIAASLALSVFDTIRNPGA
jgi:dihydropteroate synthase